jgi:hypothetical protein
VFGFDLINRKSRRGAIRESRDASRSNWKDFRKRGGLVSLAIAAIFGLVIMWLFMLRDQVVAYRPGQYVPHDITARVDFDFFDNALHDRQVNYLRDSAPRVYREATGDIWASLEDDLRTLPDRVAGLTVDQLDPPLRDILDSGSLTQLEQDRVGQDHRQRYEEDVRQFVSYAQQHLIPGGRPLVILGTADWERENLGEAHRKMKLRAAAADPANPRATPLAPDREIDAAESYPARPNDALLARLEEYAQGFDLGLGTKIARIAAARLFAQPNYTLDERASADEQNIAAAGADPKDAIQKLQKDSPIIIGPRILTDSDWQLLRQENEAYHKSLTADVWRLWQYRLGLALVALIVTTLLCAYVARYQPRCVRNHTRGIAMAALLLSMLLLSQLAGIGSGRLYIFGIAPTILAAIILTIAYDQRFALGVSTIQAVIVTAALDQGMGFFLILWVGVLAACFLLDDIRNRSKLIEVGGASALAMIFVTAAVGFIQMEPLRFIFDNCLYAGAAGLAAGFVVLGILPFIEKAFRITTSMTLLELADASQPLLRRLALEAPGTYNHSLQVATLAEAAAESIRANSLLCRVGSYYHDVGKINKPDYFVENQLGGENRHLNLSPSLSLRIILSHVKDGVEMAREYNLPTSLLPIIQQHHGTTLVEYFYRQAVNQNDPETGPCLSDTEFRYPGPKPRTRESAIVMICDAVESACRSMAEPTSSRLETMVHKLAMDRLHDGQLDECDLTMRDLETIERTLSKTLLGIYHGRIAYPSTSEVASGGTAEAGAGAAPTAKSA